MSANLVQRLSLAVILTALALAGCSKPTAHSGPARAGAPLIRVVTAPVERRALSTEIEAVGTARANESVEVTSKTSNRVTAIRFDEGDRVRRGEILVEFDRDEAAADLAEAEAALADSESQFKRSRDLYAQQALSISQLDQLEATLKANRARVSAAQARLNDTVIRASFDGRTGFRRVSPGSLVAPGSVITTLDDSSLIKLDFTVPETFIYMLKQGLEVTAKTAGLPDREFKGKVTNLDSRVDPVTRSIAVRAEIPNTDGQLRPGMFMTVLLCGEPRPTLMVHEAAIVPEQGKTFVFVVDGNVAKRRDVTIGRRRPGFVEITDGVNEGERVVIEGTQSVRDGDTVTEQPDDATPSS